MISLRDVYHVVSAIVPLYVVMILGYVSAKWWKMFTPLQCSGINKFVANFSIPLLTFQELSKNNPYKISLKLILSDSLQKVLAGVLMFLGVKISGKGSFNWVITGISLSTLPNTLIVGVPLLDAMYGEEAEVLVLQFLFLQCILWSNILLFLFEMSAAVKTLETPSLETRNDAEAQLEAHRKEGEKQMKLVSWRNSKVVASILKVSIQLARNPNFHATIAGLIWATIKFKYDMEMPLIVQKSIAIVADGGLGMAMFSIGIFMASQDKLIACGVRNTMIAMGMKFFIGPALMAISSVSIGLKGTSFKIAVMQAALPVGIVPFVFAKEYNVHPEIISTGVIFSMVVAIPISLAYYSLLAL